MESWLIDDPSPLGMRLIVVGIIFSIFSTLFVTLRVWTRIKIRGFGVDDGFMCAGMACGVTHNAMAVWGAFWGLGYHDYQIAVDNLPNQVQMATLGWEINYNLASALVKTSVCCAIMRIAPQKRFRILLGAMITITWVFSTFNIIALALTYNQRYYHAILLNDPAQAKLRYQALFYIPIEFAIYIAIDATCTILPLCIVWKLQMKTREKIETGCLFALASLATIATIVWLPLALQYNNVDDILYHRARAMEWAMVEVNIGIIAGSMPALRKFIGWVQDHLAGRTETASKEQEENFGLVTIGQLMGLNGMSSRHWNPEDDGRMGGAHVDRAEAALGEGDQQLAHGNRSTLEVIRVTPSTDTDATLLPQHEVKGAGGG